MRTIIFAIFLLLGCKPPANISADAPDTAWSPECLIKFEYTTVTMSASLPRTGVPATAFSSINSKELLDKLTPMGQQGWRVASTWLEMETAFAEVADAGTGRIQPNVRPQRVVVLLERDLCKR